MLAIIIISCAALIGVAFILFLWQRAPRPEGIEELPAPRAAGLFDDHSSISVQPKAATEAERASLIERARRGEFETLAQARAAHDPALYEKVLDSLVDSTATDQARFHALVSHISDNQELRANQSAALRSIELWKEAPDRSSTIEMLHVAALSDDAATYERAVETVLEFWRAGKLSQFSADDLIEIFVSHFWLIAPEARQGGAGFALKRRLLGIRRELAEVESVR